VNRYGTINVRVRKYANNAGGIGVESPHVDVDVCTDCGAVVGDRDQHDEWHDGKRT
jgi:hypothetical protein